MRLVDPSRWWTVPAIAVPGGVIAGLMPEVMPYTTAIGWAVRVVLPLTIVLATLAYPRYLAAPAAAVVTLLAVTIARCGRAELVFWRWEPAWVVRELAHPLSLTGCFCGLGFALLLLSLIGKLRRVGVDLPVGSCKHCGYDARRNKICPECGKPNPTAAI